MNKQILYITLAGLALLAIVDRSSAAPLPPVTGPAAKALLAFSHDGNYADRDDWAAVAFAPVVAWAFGKEADIVHFDYDDNMEFNKDDHTVEMRPSANGVFEQFKLNKAILFDDQAPGGAAAAVANFIAQTAKLSATTHLYFMCAGPMDIPWKCLNGTPMDKRPFVHPVSHSKWNNTHGTKQWVDIKALPGGFQFHDITDQNANFGKSSNWDPLAQMGPRFVWLKSRTNLPGAAGTDVSDAGMTWWAMTGKDNGTPAQLIAQMKLKIASEGEVTGLELGSKKGNEVKFVSHPNGIDVKLSESENIRRILVTNILGKTTSFDIKKTSSEWATVETSKLKNGMYFLSVQGENGFIQPLGKISLFH